MEIVDRLREFGAVCVMRERTPLTRDILERLPRLKLIVSTGTRNASIDVEAAAKRCGEVLHRSDAYQVRVEPDDRADLGAHSCERTKRAHRSCFRSVRRLAANRWGWHSRQGARRAWPRQYREPSCPDRGGVWDGNLVLSSRTRGLVGRPELALMKRSARLVNTSRGPIVDESALVETLREGRMAGAAIDVLTSSQCRWSIGSATWTMSWQPRTSDMCHGPSIASSTRTRSRTLPAGWEGSPMNSRLRFDVLVSAQIDGRTYGLR